MAPGTMARILQSLSTSDTWKDSYIERLFRSEVDKTQTAIGDTTASFTPKKLETLQTEQTGAPIDVETLRQQLRLVAGTTDESEIPLNEGGVLVLERENSLEVKGGGFPVMLIRYRIEQ